MITIPDIDIQNILLAAILRVAGCVVVILIGRWLAGVARRSLRAALRRTHTAPSIANIFERAVYYLTLLLAVFIALVVLGISANVLITVIGVVVVVAAVALRESLSDLAATVIFVIFVPFKVGDLIETNGTVGFVEEVLLFNTVLITLDHRKLTIPNGKIQNSNLINYSALDKIRLDLPVQLSFASDLQKAKATLLELGAKEERVLDDPPMVVDVMGLDDGRLSLVLRVYTKPNDYWGLRPALNEQIKLEFDRRGLTIPSPQLELHVDQRVPDNLDNQLSRSSKMDAN
jgi:small conductance mechanosensitive channel